MLSRDKRREIAMSIVRSMNRGVVDTITTSGQTVTINLGGYVTVTIDYSEAFVVTYAMVEGVKFDPTVITQAECSFRRRRDQVLLQELGFHEKMPSPG